MSYIKQTVHKKSLLCLFCLQALLLFCAVLYYLFNRGRAFNQIYTPEDCMLSGDAVLEADGSVSISNAEECANDFLTLVQPLKKGNYIVQINYSSTSQDSTLQVYSSKLGTYELLTAPVLLTPACQTKSLTMELMRSADDLTLEVSFLGNGQLTIHSIGIFETSAPYKRTLFYAFLICLLFNIGYIFHKGDAGRRKTILGLTAIFLASCYPLYTDYLLAGHDLPFHLLRIEGLYKGLSQGVFPVKIYPLWSQDYGYAVGIFYGDFLLFFPALLRFLGFSVQQAYKYFAAAINLGTVLISYYSFYKIFQKRFLGLSGSLLYTLSLYRLSDLYTRASVGEYTAMMFFPLILCGFYLIYMQEPAADGKHSFSWSRPLLAAVGLTGIIQSHILSCEMVLFFIILTCLLLIRKTFQWAVFRELFVSALITLFLNLGFLVPFLDYYLEGAMHLHTPEFAQSTDFYIQDKGMFPIQLLGLMQRSNGGSWSTQAGVYNEASFPLGFSLVLGLGLFLYLVLSYGRRKLPQRNYLPACLCSVFGILALFMSTCCFPWDTLTDCGKIFYTLIGNLQFPWRFLSVATVLSVFVTCYALSAIQSIFRDCFSAMIYAVFFVILSVSCGWYFYDFTFTGEPYRVYDTYELNTMAMYSYEYLPAGTAPGEIRENRIEIDGDITLTNYYKEGTRIFCHVNAPEGGTIDFPLNFYKYYTCTDQTGRKLPVSAGTNNMLRAELSAGFDGSLLIQFTEPWFWRMAELISAFTLAAVLLYWAGRRFLTSPACRSKNSL